MRHQKVHRKFNRTTNQRKALLRSLALNLVLKEKITTTLPKAKEIRSFVEKLVTKAKRFNAIHAYRCINRVLNSHNGTKKLVDELGPRMKTRPGGYLRIIKAGFRYGDQAPMGIIEFVEDKIKKDNNKKETSKNKMKEESKTSSAISLESNSKNKSVSEKESSKNSIETNTQKTNNQ